MRLTRLQLDSFRNYRELDLAFGSGVNLLYGNNAEGKTNVLEALFFLATGRSHRGARDQDLINWGAEAFTVRGHFEKSTGQTTVEIAYRLGQRKAIKINRKSEPKLSSLIGRLNVVLFAPEDLQLLKGSPANRRRLVDIQNSQVSPPYFHHLQEYTRALAQRNSLLRGPAAPAMLEIWDQPLAQHGTSLIIRRARAVREMEPRAAAFHAFLSDGREELSLLYQNSLLVKAGGPEGIADPDRIDPQGLTALFLEELRRRRPEELARGATVVGPHRDDLAVFINGKDTRLYASQGQQRTAVLAIKMAELRVLADAAGENPILLLDDVASELDAGRRRFLMDGVCGTVQTFVTTTGLEDLDARWVERANRYRVKAGVVARD